MTLGDSAVVPVLGGTGNYGVGAGLGVGGGVLGGLLAGGLAGALTSGGGLFGNRNGNVIDPAIVGLQTQVQSLQNTVDTNEISGAIGILSTSVTDQFGKVQTNMASNNLVTLTNLNALGRDVQAAANQTNLVNLNSFNQAAITNLQAFNTLQGQVQNSFNQVAQGQAAQSAQMAACCCDIKTAIHGEGEATRGLINALNLQNIQAQLADAKDQVSNLKQTLGFQANQAAQTETILKHLAHSGVIV